MYVVVRRRRRMCVLYVYNVHVVLLRRMGRKQQEEAHAEGWHTQPTGRFYNNNKKVLGHAQLYIYLSSAVKYQIERLLRSKQQYASR